MMTDLLFDHITGKLSDLDMEMVRSVPPGGNWKNIPDETVMKSKRLQQIRESGGRTTYYGRLREDKPSYTINTYFTRPGNGTFIHPRQDRLISLREGARLQSFPDSFRFFGSKPSKYKQIGNAVPPLLAKAVAGVFSGNTAIDLFAGAGGLSWGIREAGFECLVATDFDKNMCETLRKNEENKEIMHVDMTAEGTVDSVCETVENHLRGKQLDLCAGGPPCQGFSTAGNWNKTDPRNNLFKPFLEVVKTLEPRNVLIENVPGIKSMLKGEILQKILEMLQEMEYAVKWTQLKAEAFGVPQLRRRVFIFATLNNEHITYPDPLFASKGDMASKLTDTGDFFVLPMPVTVWDAISELPQLEHGQGEECVEYDSNWPQSSYQRWLRGQMTLNDMYVSYGAKLQ